MLFDVITTATTIFEREEIDYDPVPDWAAAFDARIIDQARKYSIDRGMNALPKSPESFSFATFQAVNRDALLVEIAKICRTQGAEAAVLDLIHPEVLVPSSIAIPSVGVAASLAAIPVAIEKELSWDQVADFRGDKEAQRKYRDFHLWLEHGLNAKTEQQARDIIGQKIDDYKWAIRKHGIATHVQVISSILALGTTLPFVGDKIALAAHWNEMLGYLVGAGLATSGVTATSFKCKVELDDVKRGQNREIAYLYEIQNLPSELHI